MENKTASKDIIGTWRHPATINPNNFKYKSLSDWAFNPAVGCGHACRFCYVPSASTIKLSEPLAKLGVTDPDEQWGEYVFVRDFNEQKFLSTLRSAEETPREKLSLDGNRAVMFCSTTDAYQVIRHEDPQQRAAIQAQLDRVVSRALTLILERSTLNVRILTRSPLAKQDFALMKQYGKRLMFGMSLPTLDNRLAKLYEPTAPSPSARIACLRAAKDAGLNVYVAMAPTYPECTPDDIYRTLESIKELDPVTIFHEPINIRAENVERIYKHGQEVGVEMKTEVFQSTETWREYAYKQLMLVEGLAFALGLHSKLHLWPDKTLGSVESLKQLEKLHSTHDFLFSRWLNTKWNRVSEWPGKNQ